MSGIGKEAVIFLYAFLSGCSIYFAYQILGSLRKLVKHRRWVIEAEDLVYWLAVSAYVFRQIYRTTYGEIRWYFILGILTGCLVSHRCIRWCEEKKRKYKKYLEKEKESR
ncbi:MAG: spore cortex biosynthesis protein YabQ [Schaedlerella sp.]|nr:spore cortex biosynthesis protein YabQ [Schaedlerella sp.]